MLATLYRSGGLACGDGVTGSLARLYLETATAWTRTMRYATKPLAVALLEFGDAPIVVGKSA